MSFLSLRSCKNSLFYRLMLGLSMLFWNMLFFVRFQFDSSLIAPSIEEHHHSIKGRAFPRASSSFVTERTKFGRGRRAFEFVFFLNPKKQNRRNGQKKQNDGSVMLPRRHHCAAFFGFGSGSKCRLGFQNAAAIFRMDFSRLTKL